MHTPVLPSCQSVMSPCDEMLDAQMEEIERNSTDEEEDVEICELLNESTDSRPADLISQYGSYFPIIPESHQRVIRRTAITETVDPTELQQISSYGQKEWPIQRYNTQIAYPHTNSYSC